MSSTREHKNALSERLAAPSAERLIMSEHSPPPPLRVLLYVHVHHAGHQHWRPARVTRGESVLCRASLVRSQITKVTFKC